jgi:hypothetical protein
MLLDCTKEMSILQVNSDEAAFFNVPHNYAVNFKGEKQVTVKTRGYIKLCATVMLYITTNGNTLPPYVMLNRNGVPK